jgi:hypothetical protein
LVIPQALSRKAAASTQAAALLNSLLFPPSVFLIIFAPFRILYFNPHPLSHNIAYMVFNPFCFFHNTILLRGFLLF